MILRRRLLEQRASRSVVLGPAIAFGQHHAELILRLGIGLGGLRQQFARTRRIGGCSAAEGGEVADAARIAGLGRALEQHEIGRLRMGRGLRYGCSDDDDQQALERPFHEAQVASARRQIQGSSPLSRNAGATSGDARNRSNRSASAGVFVAAIRPAENTAEVCSSYGMGPTTSMPPV